MPSPRGVFVLLVSVLLMVATVAAALPPGLAAAGGAGTPSGLLVLAEVMTGGASASDEYVEIANAGSSDADLGGCELIYVTASGATVTRKTGFVAPLLLAPGQHLLVANSAGIYGPLADATYAGGLAADGGAVVLRRADGSVIDAVGWGTATNSYVEGSAAPTPPATASIERLPGGSGGNSQDTNENRADWFVQPNPIPQSLASAPVPGSSGRPSASPIATATSTAAPTGTPTLTPYTTSTAPEPTGSTRPETSTPAPTASPAPTSTPTGTPLPSTTRLPTASPSPSASSADSPPEVEAIAAARAEPIGARVHVAGVVTVEPGLVGADDLLAIQDSSGGMFVRLSTASTGLRVGRLIEVDGTLAAPYGQLEIRGLNSLVVGADDIEPSGDLVSLGDIGEGTEGSLVTIRGTVGSVQTDGGRLTIEIGDTTGTVRLLADPPAGLSRSDVARGDVVLATGIVGQHATATGRLDGYRIWLRRGSDLLVQAPTETVPPPVLPVPTVTSVYLDLASALGTRGADVDVEGVVTATAGLLDVGSPTIVVDDGTAAVAVILPGSTTVPRVGMRVRVTGKVGRWQSGPTVTASQVLALGELQAVAPRPVAGGLDASLEWQLVRICGRIDRYVPAGSRWRLDMTVAGQTVVVLGEPAAAISVTKSSVGRLAVVAGIVRRSTSDSTLFQLLPRMALDFRLGPPPEALNGGAALTSANAASSGSGGLSAWPNARTVEIGSLATYLGQNVTVAGLVTETGSGTATVDDGTGEVRIVGASAADALEMLEPGDAIEVSGLVGEDDLGLIVEADSASIVALPGDRVDALASDAGALGVVAAGSTPTRAASSAAGAALRRASATASPPDGLTILAVVAVLLVVAVAATALANRRISLPSRPSPGRRGPSTLLARFLPGRPRPRRGEGP
jgi:hypothetical protein